MRLSVMEAGQFPRVTYAELMGNLLCEGSGLMSQRVPVRRVQKSPQSVVAPNSWKPNA